MIPVNNLTRQHIQPRTLESNYLEREFNYAPNPNRDPKNWKTMGICASPDLGPSKFYTTDKHSIEVAKKICQSCVVQETCLEYAINNREDHGVWGGKSERERRLIVRSRIAKKQ